LYTTEFFPRVIHDPGSTTRDMFIGIKREREVAKNPTPPLTI
jgi:hypothetical protein